MTQNVAPNELLGSMEERSIISPQPHIFIMPEVICHICIFFIFFLPILLQCFYICGNFLSSFFITKSFFAFGVLILKLSDTKNVTMARVLSGNTTISAHRLVRSDFPLLLFLTTNNTLRITHQAFAHIEALTSRQNTITLRFHTQRDSRDWCGCNMVCLAATGALQVIRGCGRGEPDAAC